MHIRDTRKSACLHGEAQYSVDLSQFEVLEWYPRRHFLQINWKSRSSHQEIITFYSDEPI